MAENWKPVKLAAKVIGHISQGMYRTPAGAIKELISNAYDADATYAKIHTGFPNFSEFTCEDNGYGISVKEFERLMNGGIGDSLKQTPDAERFGRNNRPIIGRLGVGLLSLAQICSRFSVVSYHPKSKCAFEAAIRFPPYTRKEIDKVIKEQGEDTLVETGEYSISNLKYIPEKTGVTITTTFVRETFKRTLSDLKNYAKLQHKGLRTSYADFEEFLACISNPKLSALFYASTYDQLLYGLALASPIPYVDDKNALGIEPCILKISELQALQKLLLSFDFRVEIDNVIMRRPLRLPSNSVATPPSDCALKEKPVEERFTLTDGFYTEKVPAKKYVFTVANRDEVFQLYYVSYSAKVNGYPLRFSAYFFAQNSRLFPKEFQGILIRIRNVAIGQYDSSFFSFPRSEGPRITMVSAEVFVDEGLDDALKVDRDGFNSLDPQFLRLQALVHSILYDLIFKSMWEEEKPRNERKRDRESTQSIQDFSSKLTEVTRAKVTGMELVKSKKNEPNVFANIDRERKVVRIYEEHPETKQVLGKRRFKGIAARVLAAFEVANTEKTPEKRREVFYNLIKGVFK
ncbi:MAG: ATP-binding protein [Opitutaceae bacterium]|nr:ATP-binding protein [Opitutaceae bacterium]